MKGFTLIELIVVFAIISVLTALGINSYSSYNRNQILQSDASDVVTMLNTAKSRAINQVIPASCSNSVTSYQVDFTVGSSSYTLSAICGGVKNLLTNDLQQNVKFTSGTTSPVNFVFSSGNVATPAQIYISGYGKMKEIDVNNEGIVSIKP